MSTYIFTTFKPCVLKTEKHTNNPVGLKIKSKHTSFLKTFYYKYCKNFLAWSIQTFILWIMFYVFSQTKKQTKHFGWGRSLKGYTLLYFI